jgi:hypothetical protein
MKQNQYPPAIDELADRVDLKFAHDIGSMCFRGSNADPKSDSDFLAALTIRQQLNNLLFPRREPVANGLRNVGNSPLFANTFQHDFRGAGSKKGLWIANASIAPTRLRSESELMM